MGAGDKFSVSFYPGFGLGIFINRFPHQLSISLTIICVNVYIGFGKGYDEV